jgi:hypothetical protein
MTLALQWRPMRKTFLILTCLFPTALAAQSIVVVPPQQCVWRIGDDPNWAAPDLDESAWQPYSTLKLDPSQSRIWIRCHLLPMALGGINQPAVQVRLAAAYELFMNGVRVGSNGDLRRGFLSMDTIRIFPILPPFAGNRSNLLTLRIVYRFAALGAANGPHAPEIRLGQVQALRDNRAGVLLLSLHNDLILFGPMVVLGIVGLVLLGFSIPDRNNPEPILLGLSCLSLGILFVDNFCGTMMTNEPAWANLGLWSLASSANTLAQASFYFALARKRIPVWFRLLIAASFVCAAWPLVELLFPPQPALRLDSIDNSIVVPGCFILLAIVLGCGPFVAFWPYRRIPARMRAVAGVTAAWGVVLVVFFLTLATNYIPGVPNFFLSRESTLFSAQSTVQACVVAALIALVVRNQRLIADQRSALAGEMEAAQKIQRALIPASIDSLSGFKIGVAFLPAREVGGDFYSCRILPGNRQRILLGDVSGKGAAAAMTAAVLLGAAERRENDLPAELLRHLNLVLCDMRLGGFATCLCADISADGALVVADAGHLPPYRDGREIEIDSGLPLGITPNVEYGETTLRIELGTMLTFLSDGVVEARNTQGELFGFERTASISTQSAESIAQAAQAFGQEDDITVLTLTFAPTGAISSLSAFGTGTAPAPVGSERR